MTPEQRTPDPDTAVARLLPSLTAVAVLLTDAPADAVRLLGAALSTPGAPADDAAARRALARVALGSRGWAAEQVVGSLPPAVPTDTDPDLADALRRLPDRDRAVLVLGLVGGSPPEERDAEADRVARRVTGELAAREDARRRDRQAFRAPGSAAPEPGPEVPLPDRLARLAAGRPLPATALDTVTATVRAARRARRRRRRRAAAGVVAVVVLAALVPLLPRGAPAPPPALVYAGAPRGSLAGDRAFLAALPGLSWGATADAGTPRVVFAGDVGGGRWVLLARGGSAARPAATAWFAGPTGATPGELRVVTVRAGPDPAQPVQLTAPGTGALVVVGARQDVVRVSERPAVGADGRVTRDLEPVPTSGGVAAVELTPMPGAVGSAVRAQVRRGGVPVPLAPAVVVTDPSPPAAALPTTRLRPAPEATGGDVAVGSRVRTVLAQLGEPAATAPVTVLWTGDLPGPNDRPARLSVVALPQPSGAVVVTLPFGYAADATGRAGSSWCATGVLPAGPPLPDRVVAVSCDISDATVNPEVSRFLVVVAPPAATSVQLLDAAGTVLGERGLTDGVAVVRSPGDVAAVQVQVPDGAPPAADVLAETDLSG